MKKLILFSALAYLLIFVNLLGYAQSVGVSVLGMPPKPSALLDVDAAGMTPQKGILIPRVTLTSTTDVTTIPSPANSLMVYNTNGSMVGGNGNGFYFYDTTAVKWIYVTSPSNGSGSSGQVLSSRGSGTSPQWQSLGAGGRGSALGTTMLTSFMDSLGLFNPHINNCTVGEAFVALYNGSSVGYCIEKSERVATNWTAASRTCIAEGKRLPEPFEFQLACDSAVSLGLNNMIDNQEWATNFTTAVPISWAPGSIGVYAMVMGGGSCNLGYIGWIAESPNGYRYSINYRCVH